MFSIKYLLNTWQFLDSSSEQNADHRSSPLPGQVIDTDETKLSTPLDEHTPDSEQPSSALSGQTPGSDLPDETSSLPPGQISKAGEPHNSTTDLQASVGESHVWVPNNVT